MEDERVKAAIADWAARDPAARLRLFVRAARPLPACLRIALGHALRGSVVAGIDTRVAGLKSAWWHGELIEAMRGRARHPLTRGLSTDLQAIAWQDLANHFSGMSAAASGGDMAARCDSMAGMEAALWFEAGDADSAACAMRAQVALLDLMEHPPGASAQGASGADARGRRIDALRDLQPRDAWTAARIAQAHFLATRAGTRSGAIISRWQETGAVWSAVRRVRE